MNNCGLFFVSAAQDIQRDRYPRTGYAYFCCSSFTIKTKCNIFNEKFRQSEEKNCSNRQDKKSGRVKQYMVKYRKYEGKPDESQGRKARSLKERKE